MKKTLKFIGILLGTLIIVALLMARFYPLKTYKVEAEGWTPLIDEALALKHQPIIYTDEAYGMPESIRYRAAKNENGHTHIAYHIFWAGERNPHTGFYPFLNRWLYTGGLSLQKTMFGKGDIEVIEIVLDESGHVMACNYETAKAYDPSAFSVSHEWVQASGETYVKDMAFEVISWNHLFDLKSISEMENHANLKKANLELTYFDQETWEAYEMFKATNTALKKNRAHFDYERLSGETR